VYCSVADRCVAVCCSVADRCVAVCCSVLQCVVVFCCNVSQCVAVWLTGVLQSYSDLQRVTVCCSVLQWDMIPRAPINESCMSSQRTHIVSVYIYAHELSFC